MNSLFDKLNLRAGERRLVVIVGLVVFFFLNLMLVWPRFGDLGRLQQHKRDLELSLSRYEAEIGRTNAYQRQLNDLRSKGADVATEAQALDLQRNVQSQAAISGVQVNSYTPITKGSGKTNVFFEEQSGTIQILTEEKSLVDFLWALGSGSSLIRVRSMQLQPEPARQKLQGSITLVASYPKKAPLPAGTVKPSSPLAKTTNVAAAKTPSPFSKPASPSTNLVAKSSAQPGLWDKVTGFFKSKPTGTNAPAGRSVTNPTPARIAPGPGTLPAKK